MILFKVSFQNNIAVNAIASAAYKAVDWKENPYVIISIDVYANNNIQALSIAQQKANVLLQKNK